MNSINYDNQNKVVTKDANNNNNNKEVEKKSIEKLLELKYQLSK